ncbi:hypothetical protein [Parasitella parasitica]|uniref:CxC2-like cysteine cluster KDZ transposase-associated domain-containing protein n=1 Tax=Parasitella parasitica TaxID=35722 RepID=A0A0B7MNS6_9FUNG|nr:hypothetical protein [Parasitella parasitica]
MSATENDLDKMRKDLLRQSMSYRSAIKKTKGKRAARSVKPVPTKVARTKKAYMVLENVQESIEATYTPAASKKTKKSKRVRDYEARQQKKPETNNVPEEPKALSDAFLQSEKLAAKWNEKKYDYFDAYLTSIRNGMPIKNAIDPETSPSCACDKSFVKVNCFFVFEFKTLEIPVCSCRDLAETLLTMQLFPKTLTNVKAAIHFGCLDLFDMFELRAQVSVTVFAEILNEINTASGLKMGLQTLNVCRLYYKRFLLFVEETVADRNRHKAGPECAVCATSDVVAYMVDGCASLKRKNTLNPEIIHLPIKQEDAMWVQQSALLQFGENDRSDTVSRRIDSNFRADNGNDMKRDMAVNGVIAVVCVHGVVKKLVNMLQGERHAHTLAAIKSIVDEKEDLGDQRPLMISYDIMCRLKKRLCKEIPSLQQSILGTPVFHAFGHSMHCQCDFNLRYLTGAGLNDGEGIERFWSEFAEFTRLTRNMTEVNRSLTLFCAAQHLGKKKIFALGDSLVNGYQHAVDLQTVIRAEILQNGDNVLQLRETWEEYAAAQRGIRDQLANNGRVPNLPQTEHDQYLAICLSYYHLAALLLSPNEGTNRARSRNTQAILCQMEEFERLNPSVSRPQSANDLALLSSDLSLQERTNAYFLGLLRISIYTIKQIKVSLKGRNKGRGNKALSIRFTIALNKEKQNAEQILTDLNKYRSSKGMAPFPALNALLRDEQQLREVVGEGMTQRLINLHLLDRAGEEIIRINLICNRLTDYFLSRVDSLKMDLADIDVSDSSATNQGMRRYIEKLLANEVVVMDTVLGKLRDAGLVSTIIANNNNFGFGFISNNVNSDEDEDGDEDNEQVV